MPRSSRTSSTHSAGARSPSASTTCAWRPRKYRVSTHAHHCTLSRLPAIQPPRRCCTAQGRGALAGYGISRLTADFTAQLQAQRRLPFWPVGQVPVPCSQTVDTGKRAFKMLPFAPLALPADELTGFEHNGVSPIGVRTRMPIIMSHRCPPASPAAPSPRPGRPPLHTL